MPFKFAMGSTQSRLSQINAQLEKENKKLKKKHAQSVKAYHLLEAAKDQKIDELSKKDNRQEWEIQKLTFQNSDKDRRIQLKNEEIDHLVSEKAEIERKLKLAEEMLSEMNKENRSVDSKNLEPIIRPNKPLPKKPAPKPLQKNKKLSPTRTAPSIPPPSIPTRNIDQIKDELIKKFESPEKNSPTEKDKINKIKIQLKQILESNPYKTGIALPNLEISYNETFGTKRFSDQSFIFQNSQLRRDLKCRSLDEVAEDLRQKYSDVAEEFRDDCGQFRWRAVIQHYGSLD